MIVRKLPSCCCHSVKSCMYYKLRAYNKRFAFSDYESFWFPVVMTKRSLEKAIAAPERARFTASPIHECFQQFIFTVSLTSCNDRRSLASSLLSSRFFQLYTTFASLLFLCSTSDLSVVKLFRFHSYRFDRFQIIIKSISSCKNTWQLVSYFHCDLYKVSNEFKEFLPC